MKNGEILHRGLNSLCVEYKPGVPKERSVYRNTALAPPIPYGVHQSCAGNVLRGVVERLFFVEGAEGLQHPPQAQVGVFEKGMRRFSALVAKRTGIATPISLDKFPEMYSGRKRTVYQAAVESIHLDGVTIRDAFLKTFTKAEKVLFEKNGLFCDPAPRIIQPRDPRYNAALGCFLKPIEHRVYEAINKTWGELTVMKGLNATRRGAAFVSAVSRRRYPAFLSSDYSRFDQSIGTQALKFEHSFYISLFPGHQKELARLLKMQLVNKGRAYCADGTVSYVVEGCRMSGDMNTSLGNVFLACGVAFAFKEFSGIDFTLLNDGDDCCFIMEQEDVDRFSRLFVPFVLTYGFRAKLEKPVTELAAVDFCQCSPIWTPGGTVMIRNPHKALAKDATSILPMHQHLMPQRLYSAIGEGGLSMSRGVPVYNSFYLAMIRAGAGVKFGSLPSILDSGFHHMHQGVQLQNDSIHPRTRFEFWLAFGILPDLQLELEAYFDGVTLPVSISPGQIHPNESVISPLTQFSYK